MRMHRHIYALALSLALAPSIALGQGASSPPAPETPVGHFLAPQQDNSLAWLPWQAATSAIGTTFNTLGTGRTAMMSVELEGDPIAVQLVFYNGSATAWQCSRQPSPLPLTTGHHLSHSVVSLHTT